MVGPDSQQGKDIQVQQPASPTPEKGLFERFGDFIMQKERYAEERAAMVKIFEKQISEIDGTLGRWNAETADVFNQNIGFRKQLLGEIRYAISRVESEHGGMQDRSMVSGTELVYEQLEKKMTSTHENMDFRKPEYVENALKNLRYMEKAIVELQPKAADVPKVARAAVAEEQKDPVVSPVTPASVTAMPLDKTPAIDQARAPAKAPETASEYEATVTGNRVRFRTTELMDKWMRVNSGEKVTVVPWAEALSPDEKTTYLRVKHPKYGIGYVASTYLKGTPTAPAIDPSARPTAILNGHPDPKNATPATLPATWPARILTDNTASTDKSVIAPSAPRVAEANATTVIAPVETDPSNSRTIEYNGRTYIFEPKGKPTSVVVDGIRHKWEFILNGGNPIFHIKEMGERFNQSVWFKPDLTGITLISGETKAVPSSSVIRTDATKIAQAEMSQTPPAVSETVPSRSEPVDIASPSIPANRAEAKESGNRVKLADSIRLVGESLAKDGLNNSVPTWSKELALDSNADKELIGLLKKAKDQSFGFREAGGTSLDFGIVKVGIPFQSFVDKPTPVTANPRWKDDMKAVLQTNLQ